MRYTAEIKLVNQEDLVKVKAGLIEPSEVRQVIVEDALVDTGTTRLSLPRSIIGQLGLDAIDKTKSRTANGIIERTVYSPVQFTLLGRSDYMTVTDLPDYAPVLIGHLVIEHLDLCIDVKRGLIYNPAHGDDWIEEQL
ncbi:hypothetical protein HYR99_26000 [Candidatus Poribacteria bacterium]|nr:hypothetical protein [Candidatus Poribacteria bacterium]